MKEIINFIDTFITNHNDCSYSVFSISTDKQQILFGISSYQSCCESWDIESEPADLKKFEGAELLDLKEVNDMANYEKDEYLCYKSIKVFTSKGDFILTAKNSHNGYYAHGVFLKSNQMSFDDSI